MGALQSKTASFSPNDDSPERSPPIYRLLRRDNIESDIGNATEGTYSAMGGEPEARHNRFFEDDVIQAKCNLLSAAEDSLNEIRMTTYKGKQGVEDASIELMDSITTATADCINEIGETVDKGIIEIQNAKENELKSFRSHFEAEKKAMQENRSQMIQEDYLRGRDDMIHEMKKHYVHTLSYIKTSPLNDNADKSMLNIYVPPYIEVLKRLKDRLLKQVHK